MPVSPLNLWQVQIQKTDFTYDNYAVQGAATPAAAIETVISNGLMPDQVLQISVSTFTSNLIS